MPPELPPDPFPSMRTVLMDAWVRPIRKPMAIASATADKPIGQLTMPELTAWAYVLSYGGLSGLLIGTLAIKILESAFGSRPYRR